VTFTTTPAITAPAWNGIVLTDEYGIAEATFTARVPGTYRVHASILGLDGVTLTTPAGSGEVEVEFRTGPVAAAKSWYTVTADASKVANGTDAQTLTVFLADAAGIGIAGVDATGVLVPQVDKTGPVFGDFTEDLTTPGLYRAPITSRVSGTFAVSLTSTLTPGVGIGLQQPSGNATTYFAPGSADVASSRLSVSPAEAPVTRPVTATALVADANGNPVAGQTVRFWIEDEAGEMFEPLPGVTYLEPRTSGTGVATIEFTSARAGVYTVFAALIGLPGVPGEVHLPGSGQVTVTFTALREVDTSLSTLRGTDGESRPVGGADPDGVHTVTVTVVDTSSAHNPIPDLPVEFRLVGAGRALARDGLAGVTDASGVAQLHIVSDAAGDVRVSARAGGPGGPEVSGAADGQWTAVPAWAAGASRPGTDLVLRFHPGPWSAESSSFAVSTGDRVADGAAAHTVSVTVRDALGNGVADAAGDLTAAATPADGVRIGQFAAVNPDSAPFDGLYAASVTATVPGVKTIAVRLGGQPVSAGRGANVKASFTPESSGPLPPVVRPSDGSELTGTGDAGSTVTVTTETGEVIGEATVDADGIWRLRPNEALSEGTIVRVTQTDELGRVSERVTWRIGQPKVLLDRADLARGERQTARAVNFQPGERVQATLYSTPVDLGIVQADADGTAVFTFGTDAGLETGGHRVEATGPLSGQAILGRFTVQTPAPAEVATPQPPAETPTPTAPKTPDERKTVTVAPPSTVPGPVAHPPTGISGSAVPAVLAASLALLAGLALLLTAAARRRERD
jgi:protocatechuate 3,4-dioxygenase beta subunit